MTVKIVRNETGKISGVVIYAKTIEEGIKAESDIIKSHKLVQTVTEIIINEK